MKYTSGLTILLVLIVITIACSSPARKLADESDLLLIQHKYDEAIAGYDRARKADPAIMLDGQLAEAYMGKAEESYLKRQYKDLPNYYNKAVGL
ncbi:MAG: hypothetical protein PHG36_10340, partial [Dehalococcoidia bacterium]|nr:hypothetical protein [Dehalococcoidia bacterium]